MQFLIIGPPRKCVRAFPAPALHAPVIRAGRKVGDDELGAGHVGFIEHRHAARIRQQLEAIPSLAAAVGLPAEAQAALRRAIGRILDRGGHVVAAAFEAVDAARAQVIVGIDEPDIAPPAKR